MPNKQRKINSTGKRNPTKRGGSKNNQETAKIPIDQTRVDSSVTTDQSRRNYKGNDHNDIPPNNHPLWGKNL